ncbi:MAG TPA: glycoside hydrolase family 20 zincin-like fold domain-containing protein [Bryobacteraceae bacterium]|nr:glycoside hydrolase family 20 zincin-like fold domain-containing protein [Bryobacteraceae bacterium]
MKVPLSLLTLGILAAGAAIGAAGAPLITPPPRHVEWAPGALAIGRGIAVEAATTEERQIGRIISAEFTRLYGIRAAAPGSGSLSVILALDSSPRGKAALKNAAGAARYTSVENGEKYLLETHAGKVVIVAPTPRGLLYGGMTLLQMAAKGSAGWEVSEARIVDYPQLGFRSLHICIFPNTELEGVRQAILLAARFKYNAIVLETWASLKSVKRPETAYEHSYSPAQIRPLVQLGQALQMEMIPMLNSWGHASGMRGSSSQHVVLDRFPQFKPLYEEDGWSFCLTNPDIYGHLFDRYEELMELFDHPKYFHLGLDEAWGHRGLMASDRCRGENPRDTLDQHLKKIVAYFTARKVRVFMWHDMFIQRDHPQLGRLSPANSVPPFNSHLVLDNLPKDVIMAAWNYNASNEWPVIRYFHEKGFPVVACPWKVRKNAVAMVDAAKKLGAMGMMQTTWDSLDVTLPTVGEAGVVAWTEPGFSIDTLPYDGGFLKPIRDLPITALPKLETSLRALGE